MADNSRAINRVFTRKVICDLIENGRNDVFDYVVKRYIDDPSNKNHGQLISEIYAHLDKQQRNEYFYMNTLLNKLLCGIHNVNTTSAFSQVRIIFTGSITGTTNEEIRLFAANSLSASSSYCLPRKYGKYIPLPPVLCFKQLIKHRNFLGKPRKINHRF